MIIKKISDDCVKVLIEAEDIQRYKVPYATLSTADEASAEFIYRLLFLIYEETGISFLEDGISVEAYPACNENYYITLTRDGDADSPMRLIKEGDEETEIFVFQIKNLKDLCGVQRLLEYTPRLFPKESKLYKCFGKYYLYFTFLPAQTEKNDFGQLLRSLCEYTDPCKSSLLCEGILNEWGIMLKEELFAKTKNH